jgi:hypothetical protein
MDEASLMGRGKTVGDLGADVHNFARGEGAVSDQLAQRGAIDQLHHQEVSAGFAANIENREDIRVIQRRCGSCFAFEALAKLRVLRRVRRQDLDRDDAIEARVAGAIDLAL